VLITNQEQLCLQNLSRKSIPSSGTRSSSDVCFGFAIEIKSGLSNHTITDSSEKVPHWQWIVTDQAFEVEQLNQTFPGGRPTKSGKHHKWDKLFIRVKPADEGPR
jgi:hypothetical protein